MNLIDVNMASEEDEFDKHIENLKTKARASFAHVYATLKARELKTVRQLDAISKQCQDDEQLKKNCIKNINVCYDNESILLENVNNYGAINFEKLNLDSSTFTLEEYVNPEDDHMYNHKTLEDLINNDNAELEAIEEAALKQITSAENCVCFVNIKSEDVSKRFRDPSPAKLPNNDIDMHNNIEADSPETSTEDEKSECSDGELKNKIDPTDDWLNLIKSQTETEPTQVTDVMEHSTIKCS